MAAYLRRLNAMRADMLQAVETHVSPLLHTLAATASRVATTDSITLDFIEKVEGGWVVMNEARTKRLSKVYSSREEAVKRLREIEYFKNHTNDAKKVGEAVDEARAAFAKQWPRQRMEFIVEPIAKDLPKFNAGQLNKQLSAAIGEKVSLDIVGSEAWVASAAAEWTAENVALIKSIPDQFFSEIEKTITREVADGARWEELAATLQERYDVTASRARLIARDQIGKFNGDLNRVRQTDLGVTHFQWQSMGDERVRDSHREYNGKIYAWDDGPDGLTPGEDYQCRCTAIPIIPHEDTESP